MKKIFFSWLICLSILIISGCSLNDSTSTNEACIMDNSTDTELSQELTKATSHRSIIPASRALSMRNSTSTNQLKAGYGGYRGYLEFNVSSIPDSAKIISARIVLYANYSSATRVFMLKSLPYPPTNFSSYSTWNMLNGSTLLTKYVRGSNASVSGSALNSKLKSSLQSNRLYFGLINRYESSSTPSMFLNFLTSSIDLYLDVQWE